MGDFLIYNRLVSKSEQAKTSFDGWALEHCPYMIESLNDMQFINIIEANEIICGKWSSHARSKSHPEDLFLSKGFHEIPLDASCCSVVAYFEYEIDAFAFKLKYC